MPYLGRVRSTVGDARTEMVGDARASVSLRPRTSAYIYGRANSRAKGLVRAESEWGALERQSRADRCRVHISQVLDFERVFAFAVTLQSRGVISQRWTLVPDGFSYERDRANRATG